jgi:hypothetical protein
MGWKKRHWIYLFIYLFLTFFIDLVCNCRQQQWLWFLLGAPGSWAISPLQPTFWWSSNFSSVLLQWLFVQAPSHWWFWCWQILSSSKICCRSKTVFIVNICIVCIFGLLVLISVIFIGQKVYALIIRNWNVTTMEEIICPCIVLFSVDTCTWFCWVVLCGCISYIWEIYNFYYAGWFIYWELYKHHWGRLCKLTVQCTP